MFDAGFFPDRFDLYRPTITTSATGEKSRTFPGTPTNSSVACLFSPNAGRFMQRMEGIELNFDAELRCQVSVDIRAEKRGQKPDKIVVTRYQGSTVSRPFVALGVVSAYEKFLIVYLQELPS